MSSAPTITIGHVIGGSFGVAFIIANSGPLGSGLRLGVVTAAVVVFAVALFAFARGIADGSIERPETASEQFGRSYWLVVLVEAVALFGGANVLDRLQPPATVPWITLVVGLHFFWLARLWPSGGREITWVAEALTFLGFAGLVIAVTADSIDVVAVISGVGAGIVLLASALSGAICSFTRRGEQSVSTPG